MNFLLRKLLNKFILLRTVNGELFKGKVLGIYQNAIVIQGKRKSTGEYTNFSNPSTYNITIDHIVWFEEDDVPSEETSDTFLISNSQAIDESVNVIENIEESVEMLGNLFGTIEGLIQDEVRNDLSSGFDIKFELAIEDKTK